MNMIQFIKDAVKEYNDNGKSTKFTAMENAICTKAKPMYMYFFARYVKGADILRLENEVLEKGDLELCYYFQKNIPGANSIRKCVERAINECDFFWIEKFLELAEEKGVYNEIKEMVEDFPRIKPSTQFNRMSFDIHHIINIANAEYENNGRTRHFAELEKWAIHSSGLAYGRLFIEHTPGASVKELERAALLKGEPFNMFWIATQVPGANLVKMLKGLELAKLDYITTDQEMLEKSIRREEIKESLQKTDDKREIYRLLKAYKKILPTSEYVSKIDNDYITRINYMLKEANEKNRV